ncbi:unnamed protein product [Microthlaspi erraticum]|uniref:Bet v I/Major latex protein domain-containing protein n=1 Tax=Microthlaspi erraticum TaxID=1685480 RepID=A0A6D2J8J0_9BRAS|nr:unnamed protein product [Microthlaspi erraticum]
MAILNGYLSDEFDIKSPFHKFFEAYNSMMGLSEASATGDKDNVDNIPVVKKMRTVRTKAIPIAECKLEGKMSFAKLDDDDLVRATWTIEFEKPSSEIDDPKFIRNNCVAFFTKMDESLLE